MQDLKKTELFKKFERFGLIDSDMWKYLGRLDELLPVIQKFLEYVPITYPHHTSHNIQHSLTVVHRIGQLLEDELVKEMTNVEFFIIVASALLHDTGMVVSQEELERFENDPESQGTTSEYFRKNHASRSAKFVHDIQKLLDPSGPRNSRMIRYIAKICEAHGLPMERLEDDEEFPRRVEIDLQEVNVKFLAACLRLGDLLDMDYQRACPIIIEMIKPMPNGTLEHWQRHELDDFYVSHSEIRIKKTCKSTAEHKLLENWTRWLKRETEHTAGLFGHDERLRFIPPIPRISIESDGSYVPWPDPFTPLSFASDIEQHVSRFVGREWLLAKVDAWLDNPKAPRCFWIVGEPGVGKTAISAWLCNSYDDVGAWYFCSYGYAQRSDPRAFIISIASQLSHKLPKYRLLLSKFNLEKIMESYSAHDLFDNLIRQPLSGDFPKPERPIAVLIDALDNAKLQGSSTNDLASFINSEFEKAPEWLKLIITSRLQPELTHFLHDYEKHEIIGNSEENKNDISLYVNMKIAEMDLSDIDPCKIVDKSEGIFLYAYYMLQDLSQDRRPERIPSGIGGYYSQSFEDRFLSVENYLAQIRPAFEVISASQEPVDLDTLAGIFGWDDQNRHDFCQLVSPLFRITDDHIEPFHSSIMDWLIDLGSKPYNIRVENGHKILADYGWEQYELHGKTDLSRMSKYLLSYLPFHLIKSRSWERLSNILPERRFIETRYSMNLIYQTVSDFANVIALTNGMSIVSKQKIINEVSESLVAILGEIGAESLRMQLRSFLNQSFKNYAGWPQPLRTCLEESDNDIIAVFLGDTYDMENDFEGAETVFRKALSREDRSDGDKFYPSLSVRFAVELEHQARPESGLFVLDNLIIMKCNAQDRYGKDYWWAQYQKGICLIKLSRYNEAQEILSKVAAESEELSRQTSAKHQLAVIDLEMGKYAEAEKRLNECLNERADDIWNHRLAYEHHRLGQVYALSQRHEEARRAFDKAILISIRSGNQRYIREVRRSIINYLALPELLGKFVRNLQKSEILDEFNVDEASLEAALRCLVCHVQKPKRPLGYC